MKNHKIFNEFFLFAILCFLCGVAPVKAASVESKSNTMTSQQKSTKDLAIFLGSGNQIFNTNISNITVDLNEITGNKTGTVLTLDSSISASLLHWEPVKEGYAARYRITANDQIKRLRFHLTFQKTPQSAIRFLVKGSLDNSPIGPIDYAAMNKDSVWLPITNGNSADLEIFVTDLSETSYFKIDLINLIVVDLGKEKDSLTLTKRLGLAENEQYDVFCWLSDIDYFELKEAASATALISFIDQGNSYTCTGTLLNDLGSTLTPWFVTANHCISDQSVANTAEFDWHYESILCGGSYTSSRHQKTFGGAELLWNDFTMDVSFLKLNNMPSFEVVLSGWDTDLEIGDSVWVVHHPQGDHTMVSHGKVTELFKPVEDHILDVVVYDVGSTEGGSSGAGLFATKNGTRWKGTLFGGPKDNIKIDYYSHFGSYFGALKQWLVDPALNCLFNWGEKQFPNLLSPHSNGTLESYPYTYRYYINTDSYLGYSSLNDHLYYLGRDGKLLDIGHIRDWLKKAGCNRT